MLEMLERRHAINTIPKHQDLIALSLRFAKLLRKATKKGFFRVSWPLRGKVRTLPLRKITSFESLFKLFKKKVSVLPS